MDKSNEAFVYQKLKNAIIKRYIKQGTKLVETALATQLKVSRTPVRGAIRRLVYEGFATYETNKGACVIEPTLEEIQGTFFVRTQLEKAAARLAAKQITEMQLKRLRACLDEERAIFTKRDLEAYYRVNDAIHLTIAEASGNTVLSRYIEELLNRTKIYLILYDPFFSMPIYPSIHEHQQVVDAIETGDPTAAEREMETHLTSAFEGMEIQVLPEDYISL
ncbi:MAG: GntR family transcriptional regulator [Desulfosarcinaceae bacterium]|nr:GntR family transcriptional regulator [Desulfosarcinaceae bacterium]